MKVAVYSLTRDRLADTQKAFPALREKAGIEFDHFVWDNGSTDGTVEWLREHEKDFKFLHFSPDNKGQCIPSNRLFAAIGDSYEYIIRFDNDTIIQTDGLLAKLIEAQSYLGRGAIVSPMVYGLINPPPPYAETTLHGTKFIFVDILGGICRVHPIRSLKGFKFGEHGCLALGEAAKLSDYCIANKIPMAYVDNLVVEHDTPAHIKGNIEYFKRRQIEQYVPYGL